MDADLQLFKSHSNGDTVVFRLYRWSSPAISLGKLQHKDILDLSMIEKDGIFVVNRPTGGRHIFHCEDISFSIIIPRSLFPLWGKTVAEQQSMVGEYFLTALKQISIFAELNNSKASRKILQNEVKSNCFSTTIPSEICVNGKKLVGIAHRITSEGALIQGTIPLTNRYLDIVKYEFGSNSEKEKRLKLLKKKSCSLQSVNAAPLPSFEMIGELWGTEFLQFAKNLHQNKRDSK